MTKETKALFPLAHVAAHLPLLKHKDVPSTVLMQTLHYALSRRRVAGSICEARFTAWLANCCAVTMIDGAGNLHIDARKDKTHRTMFTAHTDTVHSTGGTNAIRYDVTQGMWHADKGHALGGDDGAGIALMVHMLDAGVPGYYVFFRDEESGGIGSHWLASTMHALLKDFDRCVSFDRAGYHDVITHQAGGRCCSETFAEALATALTRDDMSLVYVPDAGGVFTDSANMAQAIPECTNISVGYANQHGDREWQDVGFLQILARQVAAIHWDSLPTERDPRLDEYPQPHTSMKWSDTPATGKIDDFDEYVADSLSDAATGDPAALRAIVAEHLLPGQPEMARRHIDTQRVMARAYEEYADGIYAGDFDATQILDILICDLYVD